MVEVVEVTEMSVREVGKSRKKVGELREMRKGGLEEVRENE